MDGTRFDALTCSLTVAGSRRRALVATLGGALSLLGWQRVDDTAAHSTLKTCKKKSGKARKSCLKKAKAHNAQHASETSAAPPPPPSGPTCSDGIKNGNETDIDCGGSCPRCITGYRCTTRNDCASGYCSGGTCHWCSFNSNCPPDPGQCVCGGNGHCHRTSGTTAPNCGSCPADTGICSPLNVGVACSKLCGAA